MHHPLALSALLLTTALAAQTPACIAYNDGNTNVGTAITAYGFGGPGVYGWQFTTSNPLVLFGAQIYTEAGNLSGGTRGYQSLEIWDTNFIFTPQSRLGGGTWQNQPALGVAWQGCNFDQPVVINPGQTYWLVWRESGFNRLPYEPGGVTTTTVQFLNGSWQTLATSAAPKWRGFCSPLDGANVQPYGAGCVSSLNTEPAIFTNHEPSIGNAELQLEGTGFPPGSVGLCVLGSDPAWGSVPVPGAAPGCQLHTDALVTAAVAVGTGNQQALHTTGASGHCWLDLPIPNVPSLAGVVVGAQFAVFDPAIGASLPFVFSSGLRLTLF